MRIVIADDHAVSRRGLALLIADHFGAVDVAEAESLDAAIAVLVTGPETAMVVLDLRMPGMRGAEGIATLREAFPQTKVVILSGSDVRDDVLAALAAGAHAFIRKAESEDALVRALRLVLEGGIYVTPDLATLPDNHVPSGAELEAPASPPMAGFDIATLSPRQQEVFEHLAFGRPTKEIARLLNVAEGTVKVHIAAVQRAIGARNRAEAVAMCARYQSLRL